MKRCPTCNRTYTDLSLNFCLEDGTPLITGAADPNATIRYPGARDTSEPPPTEIYRPTAPAVSSRPTAPPPPPPPQWSPAPAQPPRKKSNAVWWILGGLAAVAVIGVGLVVMLIALASLGSNVNNSNVNANTRNENRNSNISANTNANANTNTSLPASIADDFSEQKWGIANSPYGRTWYDDDEYRMVSKERTFVVMYAPSDAYNTENARVSVTARSVDGSVPSAGFGLIVHGELKAGKLEDYALLIYPDEEPSYQIVMHKNGTQSTLVDKTKTDAIKPGSAPNELEIRIKGPELLFYANGQLLNRVKDAENYRRGRAGFYTSDIHEVAFDDLVINR
jgi:hypothetical protein